MITEQCTGATPVLNAKFIHYATTNKACPLMNSFNKQILGSKNIFVLIKNY